MLDSEDSYTFVFQKKLKKRIPNANSITKFSKVSLHEMQQRVKIVVSWSGPYKVPSSVQPIHTLKTLETYSLCLNNDDRSSLSKFGDVT